MKFKRKGEKIPQYSVGRYIRSIGRYYLGAAVIMTLLIGAVYLTVREALDRHSLQQEISFITAHQFIRFQQLGQQTRALMRASVDPKIPENIIAPMVRDVKGGVAEVRATIAQLEAGRKRLDRNYLERLNPRDEDAAALYVELKGSLEDFLRRAERVANASTEERRQRYSFWGPVDFAVASESALMRGFNALTKQVYERSELSISFATLVSTVLLALLALISVLASALIFRPLLKKLQYEHHRTVEYKGKLKQQAHTDGLTNLHNRISFNQAIQRLFERLAQGDDGFSLLLVDLDYFKAINDNHGHPAGDTALRHTAEALRRVFREEDFIARLGGDEFAVLLPKIYSAAALEGIAERALKAIIAEFHFDDQHLRLSASIGGAVAPLHATDEATLVRIADLSLYAAKAKRNRVVIFDDEDLEARLEQSRLAADLAQASVRNEFVVYYQPKVCLKNGEHLGFEALVRWQHPEQGLLPPGRFLPLMESAHLMRDMTNAVVDIVGRDLKIWKEAGITPGPVAINLPEVLLSGEEGYAMFAAAVSVHGIEWRDFAVEVTENVFLNRHPEQILNIIKRFQDQGVTISLDDFGTGFASLLHLRDFPFDELKIDRSFVANIGQDRKSEQIIKAIVGLSRNLGKRCVAEGIETDAQLGFLLNLGCEVGQGFLFARPALAEEQTRHLTENVTAGQNRAVHCGNAGEKTPSCTHGHLGGET